MQPATSCGPDGICLPPPNHNAAETGLLKVRPVKGRELDHGPGSSCFNIEKVLE